jgi:Zinc knuckle
MMIKWKFIELLEERKPGDVEEAMRRTEEKKQEKLVYKATYGGKITPKVKESTALVMDIGKRKVTCGYCGKPNHTVNVCRKKLTRIKLASRKELKEKGLCFRCGQEGHMTRNCKVKKVAIVNEEIKTPSMYTELTVRKEEVRVSQKSPQV